MFECSLCDAKDCTIRGTYNNRNECKDFHAAPAPTLRDFFAGCSLMAGYASGGGGITGLAIRAYEIADAMLNARDAE